MQVTCKTCDARYDDALCMTYCPHERFISDEAAARKDLGYGLLGKLVTLVPWTGNADAAPRTRRVMSMTREGYVTLEGLPGRVAPEILRVVT